MGIQFLLLWNKSSSAVKETSENQKMEIHLSNFTRNSVIVHVEAVIRMWGHVFHKGISLSPIIFTAVCTKRERGELEGVLWLDLQGTFRRELQFAEFPNSEPTMKQPI